MKFHACILAGGTGTRLWPISRKNSPKQVKPFIDDKTLLQKTYERLLKAFDPDCIWISTNVNQKDFILQQIPEFDVTRLILEPERRDTAAAIGLAALMIHHADPDGSFIAVASDHHIIDEEEYARLLRNIGTFLETNHEHIVTIGIAPAYPETGYGYIKKGNVYEVIGEDDFYTVDQFTEKPEQILATEYVNSGEYLWNSGLFAAKTATMLSLYQEYSLDIYEKLIEMQGALGNANASEVVSQIYPQMKKISIDFAIIEKVKQIVVVPGNFGWSDVGNWNTLYDLQGKDENKNVTKGEVIAIHSESNLVYAQDKKIISLIGMDNFVVVDTPDALLICPRDRVQEVKKVVEELEKKEKKEFL